MKKIFKIILASIMTFSVFFIPANNVNAAQKENMETFALVRTVYVDETDTQYYTELTGLYFTVTVDLTGSYLLSTSGGTSSITNINLSPTVSYTPIQNSHNMIARIAKMEKTVHSNSIDVKITVLLYKNGNYEETLEFDFTV